MPKLLIFWTLLFPAIAFAQSAGAPPPPPDAQDVETARPPDSQPDMQPPVPPAVPPERPSNDDQVGILQQRSGEGVGILQGYDDDAYSEQRAPASPTTPAPGQTGQWVYTTQYGWVWMPYGQQYVDEGTYGAASPYQYVYCVGAGWSWVAAPWLLGLRRLSLLRSLGTIPLRLVSRAVSRRVRLGTLPRWPAAGLLRRRLCARRDVSRNPTHRRWIDQSERCPILRPGPILRTAPILRPGAHPGREPKLRRRCWPGAAGRPNSAGPRISASGPRGSSAPRASGGFRASGGHRR